MKHQFVYIASAFAFFMTAPTLHAGETPWFETDGGNIRVVIEPYQKSDQSVRGFIDIDLLPGWKTYWRDPGPGGIPPTIDLNDKANFAISAMHYPVPVTIKSEYGDYAGYDKPVQIAFELSADKPLTNADIDARILVGICQEICIPAFNDFKLPIREATGTSQSMINVQRVFDDLPNTASKSDVSIKMLAEEPQKAIVEISGDIDGLEFFAAGKMGEQFKKPVIISEKPDKIIFKIAPLRPFTKPQNVELMISGRTRKTTFESAISINFSS